MKPPVRSALALATLLLVAASAPALAAPARVGDFETKTVRFKRTDLSTAAGAQTLYDRITAAARVVCRSAPHAVVRGCRARAVDDAVRAVGSPLLTSIHGSMADRVEEVVLR